MEKKEHTIESINWKKIKVKEILRLLTSKMYKFNHQENYEEFEFIGDVVLKLLSTIQIFLEKAEADES